jgi:hypothetical protein
LTSTVKSSWSSTAAPSPATVGSSLAPHYEEDQPGDKLIQQLDAAEAKRLSHKELVARLMS